MTVVAATMWEVIWFALGVVGVLAILFVAALSIPDWIGDRRYNRAKKKRSARSLWFQREGRKLIHDLALIADLPLNERLRSGEGLTQEMMLAHIAAQEQRIKRLEAALTFLAESEKEDTISSRLAGVASLLGIDDTDEEAAS